MSLDIALVEANFRSLVPRADELANRFYARLFADYPMLRPMFPEDMERQKESLVATLVVIVQSLRRLEELESTVRDLAVRHIDYGVHRAHYPVVGQVLVATLSDMTGDDWNPALETSWRSAYDVIQDIVYRTLDEAEGKDA